MRTLALFLLTMVAAVAADLPYCRVTVDMGPQQPAVTDTGWWDAAHLIVFHQTPDPFAMPLNPQDILKVEYATGQVPKQPAYIAGEIKKLVDADAKKAAKAHPPLPAPAPHR